MRRECRELPVDGPHENREPVLPRFGDNRDPTGRDTDDQDTVPKCLPAGVCTTLVEEYNKITIDGDRRQFPEKQLLGIEKVLARMRRCTRRHDLSQGRKSTPTGRKTRPRSDLSSTTRATSPRSPRKTGTSDACHRLAPGTEAYSPYHTECSALSVP